MMISRTLRNIFIVLVLAVFVVGCKGEQSKEAAKTKKESVAEQAKVNIKKVTEILDILSPADGSQADPKKMEGVANSYGGIGKNVDKAVNQGVFVVYAGLENKFNLKASTPLAVITLAGNTNEFTVTKTAPFDGDVLFISHGGYKNQYTGGQQMSFAQFRADVSK